MAFDSTVRHPFISVVTPFYNTAPYLAQCIESVLAQTHENFEYALVDNCSTDGSAEIAESFARRDPRIRLVRRTQLLTQVENYNRAVEEISEQSCYCKIVQADDFIFPECLQQMAQVFEQRESVGLVSSYWLKGSELRGSGYPFPSPVYSGKEVARLYLRKGLWVFGSPTAVMYRSSIVKKGEPFYDPAQLHEDTDKCLQILTDWDFGFVHQVLTFSRADNESISSAVRGFQPAALDRYILVQRYASVFLEASEAADLKRKSRREYYGVLAKEALRGRESEFWQYHSRGLCTRGEKIDRTYLAFRLVLQVLWSAVNPGATLARLLRFLRRRSQPKGSAVNLLVTAEESAAPGKSASPPRNSG